MKISKKIAILAAMTILLGAAAAFKVWALQSSADQDYNPQPVAMRFSPAKSTKLVIDGPIFADQYAGSSSKLSNLKFIPGTVPVLMYHYVGDLPPNADKLRIGLTVSSADFAAQMAELQAMGYHSITSQQLYNYLANKGSLPAKPVLIAFDDGYADAFQNAVPILLQHKMVGMFAVITGAVGYPNYADWQQIAAAQAQGMDIVSHTVDHIDLASSKYTQADLLKELIDSRQAIQQNLGILPDVLVYPYGGHDSQVEQLLKQTGYKMAFTTQAGFAGKGQDLLALPRVRVSGGETMQKFEIDLGILPPDPKLQNIVSPTTD